MTWNKDDSNFGIIGIEYQLPSLVVDEVDLAKYLNWEPEKLTIGLELLECGTVIDCEDSISLALSAVDRLMKKYNIDVNSVGRIDVGTESNHDSSKAFKTYLMNLFPGNNSICGLDTTNACYGGTAAFLNAIAWLESSLWDGRYAIVVATDVALYKDLPPLPTTGAGAVAMLLGPNAALKIKRGTLSHHFANTFDFMKPKTLYPHSFLDGKVSVQIYLEAFQKCYEKLNSSYDYMVFHTPYPKLTKKAAVLVGASPDKIEKSLEIPRRNGNSYTASAYMALVSLLSNNIAIGEKILFFSLGSGLASSLFVLEKCGEISTVGIKERLDLRKKISPEELVQRTSRIPELENFVPSDTPIFSGWYLKEINNYKRTYFKYE
ncbi:3-hydroxy-3-methylglutaryl CoA synthase [Hamiltosporidium magnivora]|uniref:3-hydroxy-3-methylglutaryl CoA synthase n=1 Tax=Hamiltosporidium magnivora TaxID=148818 RepID=A0A4Q9LES8_9MICR|nr:3-hydroxy-3-methylglutaryl CoA synthase [Hamiltosporidium magnivora]